MHVVCVRVFSFTIEDFLIWWTAHEKKNVGILGCLKFSCCSTSSYYFFWGGGCGGEGYFCVYFVLFLFS